MAGQSAARRSEYAFPEGACSTCAFTKYASRANGMQVVKLVCDPQQRMRNGRCLRKTRLVLAFPRLARIREQHLRRQPRESEPTQQHNSLAMDTQLMPTCNYTRDAGHVSV